MGEVVEISWSSHHENLCEGIWRLFDTKVGRDFQILLKNKTNSENNHFLDAHFFILQIFCQALGNSNLRQFQFGPDEDINSEDLRCLLEFMYRGKTQVELKRLNSVKKAAEKLGLNAFVDIVGDKLKDGILNVEEEKLQHYVRKEKQRGGERRIKSENEFDESGMVIFSYDSVYDLPEEQIEEDLDEETVRNMENGESSSNYTLKNVLDNNNSFSCDISKEACETGARKNLRTSDDSENFANDIEQRKKKVKLNSSHQTFTIRVDKVSSGNERLKSHTELRVCIKRLKCSRCEFRCANRVELKNHLKFKHLMSEALASGIINNIMKNAKGFKEEFRCKKCEFRCSMQFELESHLKVKHLFYETSASGTVNDIPDIIKINKNLADELQCTKCEFRCTARTDLKNHLKMRHVLSEAVAAGIVSNLLKSNKGADDESIKPKCNSESGNVETTEIESEGLGNAVSKCENPAVTFGQPQVLADLDSKELLQCPFCSYKTKNLESHMIGKHRRDLTGNFLEKSYKCDECDFTCEANFVLLNHKKCKHGEKRFKCDRCAYFSKTKGDLEKHVKTVHPSGRRFACEVCGSCFKFEKKLLSHKTKHVVKNENFGSDKRLKCKECEFRCGVWSELKMHWKLKHLMKEEGSSGMVNSISGHR